MSPEAFLGASEPIGAGGGENASSVPGMRLALVCGKPIPMDAVRAPSSKGGDGSGA